MELSKIREEIKEYFLNADKKKLAFWTGLIIFILILSWAFISAGVITGNFNRSQLIGTENKQGLDVQGIILTETKESTKFWELYGETGTYSSDNKIALLENVTGNFYRNNEVGMSFQSSKGTYNETNGQIILYTDTFIVLKDGTTLTCDRLIWSGSDKPVKVEGNVKINRNNELITTAQKAEISPDYSDFKVKGKTVTKLYDSKEKNKK